jgi:purine-nucleoside phosphorylase
MPVRLRPTATPTADAILVGDPGRSLLLAQELIERPRMSNHARGLWGYRGTTPAGRELTVQATGIGGPSAAAVLTDLAELRVRRAIRVGTCAAVAPGAELGELLVVERAVSAAGSAAAFGLAHGEEVRPDPWLLERLRVTLGEEASAVAVASLDALPGKPGQPVAAADMQTVAVLARARELGLAGAALLVVSESVTGERLDDPGLEVAAKRAGRAAAAVLST